jgi:hypothetical protein
LLAADKSTIQLARLVPSEPKKAWCLIWIMIAWQIRWNIRLTAKAHRQFIDS